jgi:hypothetical protein
MQFGGEGSIILDVGRWVGMSVLFKTSKQLVLDWGTVTRIWVYLSNGYISAWVWQVDRRRCMHGRASSVELCVRRSKHFNHSVD